jgi:hypothetical protein
MNAAEIIAQFQAVGAQLRVVDGGLKLRAPPGVTVPAYVLEKARAARAELIAHLSPTPPDFEERAAISEHDGGLSRAHAETLASLQAMAVPDGVTAAQVSVVIDAAALFLDRKKGVK